MNSLSNSEPSVLDSSIESFIKQLNDGSLFDDISPDVMEIAKKIVENNPNITQNKAKSPFVDVGDVS